MAEKVLTSILSNRGIPTCQLFNTEVQQKQANHCTCGQTESLADGGFTSDGASADICPNSITLSQPHPPDQLQAGQRPGRRPLA